MPRIPLVEPTAPAQSTGYTVRADPGMYNGVAAAGERVGAAVQGIGQDMQSYAFRKQDAVNAGQLIDANTRMQTGFEDYSLSLKDPHNVENGDETTFQPRWDAKRNEILADIKDQKYSPVVRQQLAAHLRQWDAESGVKVRTIVSNKQVEKAVATYQTAYDSALKRMDADGAIKLVDDGASRGLFNPEHAAQLKLAAPRMVDHYAAADLISQDPIAAEHLMGEKSEDGSYTHFPHLDPNSRMTLEFEAHKASTQLRANTAEGYAQQIGAGQIPSAEAVNKDLAAGRLTRGQAAVLLKPPAKEYDADQFASTMSKIAAYDPKNDPDKTVYAQLMGESAYGSIKGQAATDLVEMLKQKSNPRGSLANEGVTQAGKQIDQAFENGFLGHWKVTIPGKTMWDKPTTVKKPDVWAKATETRAKLYSALQTFVREKPDAKPEEIAHFVNQQMKGKQSASRANLFLLPSAAPSAPAPIVEPSE